MNDYGAGEATAWLRLLDNKRHVETFPVSMRTAGILSRRQGSHDFGRQGSRWSNLCVHRCCNSRLQQNYCEKPPDMVLSVR